MKEIYRLIAGEQFDLLTDDEKQRLADRLTRRSDVDPVDVARRLRTALADTSETERERAFLAAIAAADPSAVAPAPQPTHTRRRGLGRGRRLWQLSLAAAAGAAVVWIALAIPRGTAPGIGGSDAVFLRAERGGDVTVDIDASGAPHLTLVVETRAAATRVRWRVLAGDNATIAEGAIALTAADTALRTLAVPVPRSRLAVAGLYWLILEDPEGSVLNRWAFRVE